MCFPRSYPINHSVPPPVNSGILPVDALLEFNKEDREVVNYHSSSNFGFAGLVLTRSCMSLIYCMYGLYIYAYMRDEINYSFSMTITLLKISFWFRLNSKSRQLFNYAAPFQQFMNYFILWPYYYYIHSSPSIYYKLQIYTPTQFNIFGNLRGTSDLTKLSFSRLKLETVKVQCEHLIASNEYPPPPPPPPPKNLWWPWSNSTTM